MGIMVRLTDIALEARVSMMTVSRVLHGKPGVSKATRERVQAVADRLGYVPDAMAQSLRARSPRLLAALVPSLSDPVWSLALQAIEERVHLMGFDFLLAQSQGLREREEVCLRRLMARRVEGLFLASSVQATATSPVYLQLQESHAKVVALGHTDPAASVAGFHAVGHDETAASRKVTTHLIELGHARIAFFAGPSLSASARARFEGYRLALQKHGLPQDERLVFGAGMTVADGAKAVERFVAESARATAIQAVNDLVALGAVAALAQRGLRVPTDLSVAGYGDLLPGEAAPVPLTTVKQPKYALGEKAVEAMAALLRGQRPDVTLLSAELVVRSSTGPPPGTACGA